MARIEKTELIHIRLPKGIKNLLQECATKEDRSLTSLVNQLIEEYFKNKQEVM